MKRIELNIQRFGHTNSTTYYELPQFVGTDKPQWLTDINQSYLAIDTAIHNAYSLASITSTNLGDISDLTTTAKTDVVSAINEVDSDLGTLSTTVANHTIAIGDNTTAIGTLANLTTTAKTDLVSAVNEVDLVASNNATSIGTLANLDTTAKSNLVSAINEVNTNTDNLTNKFDLTATSYGSSELALSGCTLTSGSITVAKNNDGSICKVYGELLLNKTQQVGTITIHNAGINPTSEFTVSCAGFEFNANTYGFQTAGIIFKTNGDIDIISYGVSSGGARLVLMPFVIFTKDFGDN